MRYKVTMNFYMFYGYLNPKLDIGILVSTWVLDDVITVCINQINTFMFVLSMFYILCLHLDYDLINITNLYSNI